MKKKIITSFLLSVISITSCVYAMEGLGDEKSVPYVGVALGHRISKDLSGPFRIMEEDSSIDDSIFDGIALPKHNNPTYWTNENEVHKAFVISQDLETTGFLLGPQTIALRDQSRLFSYVIAPEGGVLYMMKFAQSGKMVEKRLVSEESVRRAHIALNKYTGETLVLQASKNGRLYLNGIYIPTEDEDIDFPMIKFSQVEIGFFQTSQPTYGLMTYKSRKTGKAYYRKFESIIKDAYASEEDSSKSEKHPFIITGSSKTEWSFSEEQPLAINHLLGGIDLAISEDSVMLSGNVISGSNEIVPHVSYSVDQANSFTNFLPVNFTENKMKFLPTNTSLFVDRGGNFHVPLSANVQGQSALLDFVPGLSVTEALLYGKPGNNLGTLAVFPKAGYKSSKSSMPERGTIFKPSLQSGDGVTDGAGIIATGIMDGKLYSSNSQTGGKSYPKKILLNHEMPKIFAFKNSDCCYTAGCLPNFVSMDYVFIEANEDGDPISRTLLMETWHMPLPTPQLEAKAEGNTIRVKIQKDAYFEHSKTTFSLSDPSVGITIAEMSDREAFLKCSKADLSGLLLKFQMKNVLYFHEGEAVIE